MKRLGIIFITCLISINVFSISDTIMVSDKNQTYVEFFGKLIICDLGIYKNEEKKVSKEGGGIVIETDNYRVTAIDGFATIIAKKEFSLDTKLFIRTDEEYYQLTLNYFKGDGEIKFYNLKDPLYKEKSARNSGNYNTENENSENYAEINDLPEKVDYEKRRDLLKYDPKTVKEKLDEIEQKEETSYDIKVIENGVGLALTGLANDETHFYIKLILKNFSNVDYRLEVSEIHYIKVSKDRVLSKKNEDKEKLNNIIKKEKMVTKGKEDTKMIYAIPLFALDDISYINIHFKEFQGKRELNINIPAEKLNNSEKI